jgi:hypothetical protein
MFLLSLFSLVFNFTLSGIILITNERGFLKNKKRCDGEPRFNYVVENLVTLLIDFTFHALTPFGIPLF